MSVGGISGNLNALHRQNHAGASPASSAAASDAAGSIANTGSVTAGNIASFFQSFSSNLQSMLSKAGNAAGGGGTTQTTANQPLAGTRHHHPEGGGGPVQSAASQMTAQIGQGTGGGSLSAGGISHSASVFAADAMRALKAYGATA